MSGLVRPPTVVDELEQIGCGAEGTAELMDKDAKRDGQ